MTLALSSPPLLEPFLSFSRTCPSRRLLLGQAVTSLSFSLRRFSLFR
ncbi:hypothetical protein PC116_g7693 [Phytophthora cactorum]|nr:hypothetical protein PC114_g4845 [Phytophthora cactorum]KAG3137628.1 hypothetical protein C6341_g20921 [Phytophthora cactorum]KAG4244455.1 hypothetical protein PC116_g7693 [Phytophthora cactorum]